MTSTTPPSAIVVFDGEKAGKWETIGRTLQQTTFFWTLYLCASSFGTDTEGRLGTQGAYQMIDDAIAKLEGFPITTPDGQQDKLVYIGAARYHVGDTVVIYESRWRHQFVRQES
jgi:hypothetical protein